MSEIKGNEKTVALLVLNYNCKPFLGYCLRSLLNQTYQNFQIFLIDNHSIDDSVDFVKKEFPQIKIISISENFGFGKGFNEGIRSVQSEFDYIGLLNPDIRADERWLEECVTILRENPRIEICSSLVLDWEGETVDNAGGIIINLIAGIFGGLLAGAEVNEIERKYKGRAFPIFFGIATAIFVRSEIFSKYGLFDESYFMYFEDVDFSWRVLLGKGEIWCNPKAIIFHYGHGAQVTKEISLLLLKQTERNLLATYFKNLSLSSFFAILPLLIVIRTVGSLIYFPISPKITLSKLRGIWVFIVELVSRKEYREKRKMVQMERKLKDWQVLRKNPGSLVSFVPLFRLLIPWLVRIWGVYKLKQQA